MGRKAAFFLLVASLSWHPACSAGGPNWGALVYKVQVLRSDGVLELGSAVPVDETHVMTNCHVLRGAARIQVLVDDEPRPARLDRGDAYRDLCLLKLAGRPLKPPSVLPAPQVRVGLEVVAVGYPGGALDITRGRILALYPCHCRGGSVIQTSAPFDRGASGGGLFDRAGRLVGILTFKARAGGDFYFALPPDWLAYLTAAGAPRGEGGFSFWEQPDGGADYFLHACDLEARRQWQSLAPFAHRWVVEEPDNPEAWMALGRSERALANDAAATDAFRHVLALDPTRGDALDALRALGDGKR